MSNILGGEVKLVFIFILFFPKEKVELVVLHVTL